MTTTTTTDTTDTTAPPKHHPNRPVPNHRSHHERQPGAWLTVTRPTDGRKPTLPTLDHYDQTEH